MNRNRQSEPVITLILLIAALAVICTVAEAQSIQVQGVISGRSGATMTLQSPDNPKQVVLLTDDTDVEEVQGIFHARRKQMGLTALIPGLPVQLQATYNAQGQLVADTVKFKGNDLKTAEDQQAGLQPTEQQVQANQQQIQKSEQELAAQQGGAGTTARPTYRRAAEDCRQ